MPSIKNVSFSITSLLLVTAVVAAVLSNFMLRKERETLRISNRNMANELLSQYEISDLGKVHWSEIKSPSKMMWRFRVYVPPGEQMQISYGIGPFTGDFPQSIRPFEEVINGSDQLQTITIQIRKRNATTVKIDAFKNGAFAHGVISGPWKLFSWLDQLEELRSLSGQGVEKWPNLADANENIILLAKSESELQGMPFVGTRAIANPPNRFMIWLAPVK